MFTVVGIERGKSYSFKDGNSCRGNVYYCTCVRDNVSGLAVERFFVAENKFTHCFPHGEPVLGSTCNVYYNRFGKIDIVDVFPEDE